MQALLVIFACQLVNSTTKNEVKCTLNAHSSINLQANNFTKSNIAAKLNTKLPIAISISNNCSNYFGGKFGIFCPRVMNCP